MSRFVEVLRHAYTVRFSQAKLNLGTVVAFIALSLASPVMPPGSPAGCLPNS